MNDNIYSGKLVSLRGLDTAKNWELSINGELIPFFSANISMKVGEPITITATLPAESIDIKAFEENTKLIIVSETES